MFYKEHIVAYANTCNFQMVLNSWSDWNSEMLIFVEGGKPEKNLVCDFIMALQVDSTNKQDIHIMTT
jgi:hypothetical protein